MRPGRRILRRVQEWMAIIRLPWRVREHRLGRGKESMQRLGRRVRGTARVVSGCRSLACRRAQLIPSRWPATVNTSCAQSKSFAVSHGIRLIQQSPGQCTPIQRPPMIPTKFHLPRARSWTLWMRPVNGGSAATRLDRSAVSFGSVVAPCAFSSFVPCLVCPSNYVQLLP